MAQLTGRIVTPNDPKYNQARTNLNTSIPFYPKIIVFCQSTEDVRNALLWAKENCIPFRLRSGRHSYENFSLLNDGLVIDISEMNKIHVDQVNHIASIQAGAALGNVYKELWKFRQTIPAGTVANVGLVGLTLGGGIGYLTRIFGLTCDNLLEVELVLASGKIVTTNKKEHPDLFWALRGGGGGNFGIVTQLTYQTHDISYVSIFRITYDWDDFECAYDAWQNWAPFTTTRLTSSIEMKADRTIILDGQFTGTVRELKTHLVPLIKKCRPNSIKAKYTSFYQATLFFDDPLENVPAPFKRSGSFIENVLPQEALVSMKKLLENAPNKNSAIWQQALCGIAGEPEPSDTAFFYRNSIIAQEYNTTWTYPKERSSNIRWVESVRQTLSRYTNGDYVNWPDIYIKNWQTTYYGTNYAKLQDVKTIYDPDNIFCFPQSIMPRTT